MKKPTYSRDGIALAARDLRRATRGTMTQTQAESRVREAVREQTAKQANGNK